MRTHRHRVCLLFSLQWLETHALRQPSLQVNFSSHTRPTHRNTSNVKAGAMPWSDNALPVRCGTRDLPLVLTIQAAATMARWANHSSTVTRRRTATPDSAPRTRSGTPIRASASSTPTASSATSSSSIRSQASLNTAILSAEKPRRPPGNRRQPQPWQQPQQPELRPPRGDLRSRTAGPTRYGTLTPGAVYTAILPRNPASSRPPPPRDKPLPEPLQNRLVPVPTLRFVSCRTQPLTTCT